MAADEATSAADQRMSYRQILSSVRSHTRSITARDWANPLGRLVE
jgi:hypothetical protein